MSAREWKPGDVALAPWPEHAAEGEVTFSERRIVRFDGLSAGWARADDPDDYLLDSHDWSPTNIARPLAVIDPESREQVERLASVHKWMGTNANVVGDLADALREFANPTPPKCGAALLIKGEHFPCDSDEGHGLPHGNRAAEAVWGESA